MNQRVANSEPLVPFQEYRTPVFITLAVLLLSFLLHLKFCGTPLRSSASDWEGMLNGHLTEYPFSMRYFTSYPVAWLHSALGLPVKETFFILQYLLAFVLGIAFYHYLRVSRFSSQMSSLGVFLVLSAYPVLCAHFEPVHTWDDFWVYLFLVLSFGMIMKGGIYTGSLLFTLACFAREQTLLFYPMLVFATSWFAPRASKVKMISALLVPIVVYGTFYALVWENPDPKRFSLLAFNFEHPLRSKDTIYSLFISFGALWVAAAAGCARVVRGWKTSATRHEQLFVWAALMTIPLTVVFTLCLTAARETRIFFPPFLFLIPLALIELRWVWSRLRSLRAPIVYAWIGGMVILMVIGFRLGHLLFPAFEYRNCPGYAMQCAGVHIGLIFCLVLVWVLGRNAEARSMKAR